MSLKKFLKRLTLENHQRSKPTIRPCYNRPFFFVNSGQMIIEYFILLVVLIFFTVIASSSFFKQARQATEDFTNEAVDRIAPDIW